MKRLIAFISILMMVSVASGTAVSITIYGTNKSNAQTNVTCYGCNNTISVQAWNTSYVKNISVNTVNASGDVVSFNISNVTAYQVQELKVNGTAINAYQAGANGMLNFSYNVSGNKTLVLSPAVNVNGYNMTWIRMWNPWVPSHQNIATRLKDTVYQNTNSTTRHVAFCWSTEATGELQSDANNPPTTAILDVAAGSAECASFIVLPNNYYRWVPGATGTLVATVQEVNI